MAGGPRKLSGRNRSPKEQSGAGKHLCPTELAGRRLPELGAQELSGVRSWCRKERGAKGILGADPDVRGNKDICRIELGVTEAAEARAPELRPER